MVHEFLSGVSLIVAAVVLLAAAGNSVTLNLLSAVCAAFGLFILGDLLWELL